MTALVAAGTLNCAPRHTTRQFRVEARGVASSRRGSRNEGDSRFAERTPRAGAKAQAVRTRPARPRRCRACKAAARAPACNRAHEERAAASQRGGGGRAAQGPAGRAGRASSAANFSTAVKGASSGTLKLHASTGPQHTPLRGAASMSLTYTRNGSLGSDVSVTLKVTLAPLLAMDGSRPSSCDEVGRDEQRRGGLRHRLARAAAGTALHFAARPCAHARPAWRAAAPGAAPGAAPAARGGDVAERARGAAARPHAGAGRGARRHGAGGSGGRHCSRDRRRNGCVRATRSAEGCSDVRFAAAGKSSWSFSSGTPLLQSSLTWAGGADGRVAARGAAGVQPRAVH